MPFSSFVYSVLNTLCVFTISQRAVILLHPYMRLLYSCTEQLQLLRTFPLDSFSISFSIFLLIYHMTGQSDLPGCCKIILPCTSNPFVWPHLITSFGSFPLSHLPYSFPFPLPPPFYFSAADVTYFG